MNSKPSLCAVLALLLACVCLTACASQNSRPAPLSLAEADQRFQTGKVQYDQGLYQQAYDSFVAAEQAQYQRAASLSNAGASLLAQGEVRQAKGFMESAVSADPYLAEAQYNLGLALYAEGSFDQALATLRSALELAPENPAVLTAMGAVFMATRQPRSSIDMFTRALATDPNNVTILADRAAAYVAAGFYDEAEKAWNKLAAMHNGGNGMVFMGLGETMLMQKRYAEAVEAFTKAIAFTPMSSMAYYNRGIAQQSLGMYAKAVEDYTHALGYDPGYAEALVNRGDTYFLMRKPDEACVDLEAACKAKLCTRLESARAVGQCS